MPSLAVVLCTCDGAAYLDQQLESLAAQTRRPDRIVVRDDASTDDSVAIVRQVAERRHLDVTITVNPVRLGVAANFGAALADASEDLLALCDQDDLWDPAKLAVLSARLEEDPTASAACGDVRRIDAAGHALGASVWEWAGFGAPDRSAMDGPGRFGPLLRTNVVPGASLLVRREALDLLLPFSPHGFYDHWMMILLTATGHVAFVEQALQSYRLHDRNTVGLDRPTRGLRRGARLARRRSRADDADFRDELLGRLAQHSADVPDAALAELAAWAALGAQRRDLSRHLPGRLFPVVRALQAGTYGRFANGATSAAYDLLFG